MFRIFPFRASLRGRALDPLYWSLLTLPSFPLQHDSFSSFISAQILFYPLGHLFTDSAHQFSEFIDT